MKKRLVSKFKYRDGDGFWIYTHKKAPSFCKQPADIISITTIKHKNGKPIKMDDQYYTPDEAMTVAIGLMIAVDSVLDWKKIRKKFKS